MAHYIGMLRLKPPTDPLETPMPVFLEPLTELSETDLTELNTLAAEQDDPVYLAAWQDWQSGHSAVRLWAGRFNDHIVGAVLTRHRCIDGLAVRRLTQGRGVASRMMTLLLEQGQWTLHRDLSDAPRTFICRRFSCPIEA